MPYLMDLPGINQSPLRLGGSNSVATISCSGICISSMYIITSDIVYSFYHALILL
ncbi:hypothetical protein PILCRDRAFT_821731 [Piloderma croceum F 1598]|uniref:Uncharacterized protein n=1 Tax=Piloderma croceum (strain F 1598) TaxID=765440 RepID=A0A0C3FNF7_PILCF|nr:hypothetical protein PILCRDRAFT_821731 [Piloderma croceum F 1598]